MKVKTFTATPDALGAYGPLHDRRRPRACRSPRLRAGKPGEAVVRFDGRRRPQRGGGARRARNSSCRARRCPRPRQDEFYHADLIGLRSRGLRRHARSARSRALHNFGAGDVMEIETPDGRRPSSSAVHATIRCRSCDLADGRIVDRAVPRRLTKEASDHVMLARDRPHAVSRRCFPGPLGISLIGKALAERPLVARRARHPRARPRQAPHRRRHARRAAVPAW